MLINDPSMYSPEELAHMVESGSLMGCSTKDLTEAQAQSLRLGTCGASEISEALGLSPFATVADFVAKKQGREWVRDMDYHRARVGRLFEPTICVMAEEDFGIKTINFDYWLRHKQYPLLSASPDRLVIMNGEVGNLQIKTSAVYPSMTDDWGDAWSDQIPSHVRMQVDQEVAVLNSWVGSLIKAEIKWSLVLVEFCYSELRPYLIWNDLSHIGATARAVSSLWKRHVVTGHEPPVDPNHPKSEDYLRRRYEGRIAETLEASDKKISRAALQYMKLRDRISKLEKQEAVAKNKVRLFMGDYKRLHVPGVAEFHNNQITKKDGSTMTRFEKPKDLRGDHE